MKDEQIKKNAFEYSLQNCCVYDDNGANDMDSIREAYLDGAHSCDEEIKRLENRLALLNDDLDKALYRKNKFRQKNQRAQQHIKYLQAELNKLRNPWISVNERLPKEDPNNKGYSVEVIGLFSNGDICKCFCSIDEEIWFIGIITSDKPTHWMSIPELKKGE